MIFEVVGVERRGVQGKNKMGILGGEGKEKYAWTDWGSLLEYPSTD